MREQWHLDRKVPIALIITLLCQAALGIVWASRISVEVSHLTTEINRVRMVQEKTNEMILSHQSRGAHETAKHRLEALESEVSILMSIYRSRMGNFPQEVP